MNTNKKPIDLELLTSIQTVEVSPFLFTRIQQRIRHKTEQTFSTTWAWSLAFGLAVLLTLNVVQLRSKYVQNNTPQIATFIDFLPNHNLYNE
jgi:hypothetical protein